MTPPHKQNTTHSAKNSTNDEIVEILLEGIEAQIVDVLLHTDTIVETGWYQQNLHTLSSVLDELQTYKIANVQTEYVLGELLDRCLIEIAANSNHTGQDPRVKLNELLRHANEEAHKQETTDQHSDQKHDTTSQTHDQQHEESKAARETTNEQRLQDIISQAAQLTAEVANPSNTHPPQAIDQQVRPELSDTLIELVKAYTTFLLERERSTKRQVQTPRRENTRDKSGRSHLGQ